MEQKLMDVELGSDGNDRLERVSDSVKTAARSWQASGTPLSPSIVSGLIGLADGLCVFGTGLVISLIYGGAWGERTQLYLSALTIASLMTIAAFYFADLYKFERIIRLRKQLTRVSVSCAVAFLLLASFAFALKISAEYSRIWAFSWFFCSTCAICLVRTSCGFFLRQWARAGGLTRNIAVVGTGEQAKRLVAHLEEVNEPWNRVIGVFDDRINRTDPQPLDNPVLGTVSDLVDYARKHRVDDIAIAMPWNAEQRILEIVAKLSDLPVDLHLGADLIAITYQNRGFSSLGGLTVLDVASKPLTGWNLVIKLLEDRILAALLLILFAPLMALIALAIKLDSRGPVFYRQPRFGFNNQIFSVFKFRTMSVGDESVHRVPQATRNDPRITRVGSLLRRTSLDELPQLFNVLQGTMSLVGPRPHAVPHNEEYAVMIRGYYARHRVKPGITGWAQVNGLRGETDDPEKMRARVKYDEYYIEHSSILFDFQILVMTAFIIWFQKSAY